MNNSLGVNKHCKAKKRYASFLSKLVDKRTNKDLDQLIQF